MNGREVSNQMDNQRSNTASQFSSQLPDVSLSDPRFVSTPMEVNKGDRSGEGAGVQPAGETAPDLVK